MIGTGNVGYHLANKPSEVNTYMSRDGGVTWIEVINKIILNFKLIKKD